MTYNQKYVFRWTPRLKRAIILVLAGLFLSGVILGFIVGRVTVIKVQGVENETPSTEVQAPVQTTTPDVTTAPTVEPDTEEIIEESVVYYDCPLDNNLQDYIRDLCEKNNLPMPLVLAVIEKESSFRAGVVSKGGDYGLMQINTINHEWLSEKYGITDFLDPYQNVFCGITILSQHYAKYEDVDKALMAYNCGATGARRVWDEGIYSTSYSTKVKELMTQYEN